MVAVVVPLTGLANVGCDEDIGVAVDPTELGGTIDPLDGTLEDGVIDPTELEPTVAGELAVAVGLGGKPTVPGGITPLGAVGVGVVPTRVDDVVGADGLGLAILDPTGVVALGMLCGTVAVGVPTPVVATPGFGLHGCDGVVIVVGVWGADADDGGVVWICAPSTAEAQAIPIQLKIVVFIVHSCSFFLDLLVETMKCNDVTRIGADVVNPQQDSADRRRA